MFFFLRQHGRPTPQPYHIHYFTAAASRHLPYRRRAPPLSPMTPPSAVFTPAAAARHATSIVATPRRCLFTYHSSPALRATL